MIPRAVDMMTAVTRIRLVSSQQERIGVVFRCNGAIKRYRYRLSRALLAVHGMYGPEVLLLVVVVYCSTPPY